MLSEYMNFSYMNICKMFLKRLRNSIAEQMND